LGDTVKIYVCGVTPYSECHIGHAMSYILFDVIRRYLEFCGYRVKYVQNFTDVDDKIIARAGQSGLSPAELAEGFIAQYFLDMDALNVKRADIYPRATEEIPKIIEVIAGLVEKGHAYQAGCDVYFRVRSFPQYGKLSHRSLSEMMTGASCEEKGENEKEHAMDFALWKAAKPGEPQWESPWGPGRPGWHIECSAMSLKYLGETVDIHGGGQDLIFPHHENEIAQSEAFTGVSPFARYWLHNGLMQLGKEKMSKSLGNLITVKEALERYSADAIRLFVLSSHYRSPLTYTEDGLEAAHRGSVRLRLAAHRENGDGPKAIEVAPYRQRFIEAMDDDFNTAQAVATLFDLAREINQAVDSGTGFQDGKKVLLSLAREVLGLNLPKARIISAGKVTFKTSSKLSAKATVIPGMVNALVNRLIEERTNCRKAKNWQRADEIRNKLAELGVTLEDTKAGTDITYKRVPSEEAINLLMKELGIYFQDTPQWTVWRYNK